MRSETTANLEGKHRWRFSTGLINPTFVGNGCTLLCGPMNFLIVLRIGRLLWSSPFLFITFSLYGVPYLRGQVQRRNPCGTNWDSFRNGPEEVMDGGTQMEMKNEAGFVLAAHGLQMALIYAYEYNCPLRHFMLRKKSLRWTRETF